MECAICLCELNDDIFEPNEDDFRCKCYFNNFVHKECFDRVDVNKCGICGTWKHLDVKNNGLLIKYINNPSTEQCLDAVKQNGMAL